MVYLLLVELAKTRFYRAPHAGSHSIAFYPHRAIGAANQAPGLAVRELCRPDIGVRKSVESGLATGRLSGGFPDRWRLPEWRYFGNQPGGPARLRVP